MDYIIDKLYHAGHFSGDWIYIKGCRMPKSTGPPGSVICFRRENMKNGMLLLGVPMDQPLKHTLAPDKYIEPGTQHFVENGFLDIPRNEIENIIVNWFSGPERHVPLCRTGDISEINSSFIELKKLAVSEKAVKKIEILNKFHF